MRVNNDMGGDHVHEGNEVIGGEVVGGNENGDKVESGIVESDELTKQFS
jgi:hypothetical protein